MQNLYASFYANSLSLSRTKRSAVRRPALLVDLSFVLFSLAVRVDAYGIVPNQQRTDVTGPRYYKLLERYGSLRKLDEVAAGSWRTIFFRNYFWWNEATDLGGWGWWFLCDSLLNFSEFSSFLLYFFLPRDGPPQILRGAPVVGSCLRTLHLHPESTGMGVNCNVIMFLNTSLIFSICF